MMSHPVFDVLSQSRARLEREVELGDALRLAQWANRDDSTHYRQPGHHTLSVYLEGGHGTHLAGQPGNTGAPGRFCVLPAEHESHWQIEGRLRFVHLYVSDAAWADRVVRLLDAEPRAMTLSQRIFGEDAALAQWAARVATLDWTDTGGRLQAHLLSHAALDRLVLLAASPRLRAAAGRVGGGLASAARRRVLDHVEAHLDGSQDTLSLSRLAALAHLSEFHFARMFRQSMGCSVHQWISQRRLMRAQQLLSDGRLPLAEVAADCGFASASHLSQACRARLGATPRQLSQALARARA
nr:helix-turn-helix transcriptional regulator [uncultured Roseateles sp.]